VVRAGDSLSIAALLLAHVDVGSVVLNFVSEVVGAAGFLVDGAGLVGGGLVGRSGVRGAGSSNSDQSGDDNDLYEGIM